MDTGCHWGSVGIAEAVSKVRLFFLRLTIQRTVAFGVYFFSHFNKFY